MNIFRIIDYNILNSKFKDEGFTLPNYNLRYENE